MIQEVALAMEAIKLNAYAKRISLDATNGRFRLHDAFKIAPTYFSVKNSKLHLDANLDHDAWKCICLDMVAEMCAFQNDQAAENDAAPVSEHM